MSAGRYWEVRQERTVLVWAASEDGARQEADTGRFVGEESWRAVPVRSIDAWDFCRDCRDILVGARPRARND